MSRAVDESSWERKEQHADQYGAAAATGSARGSVSQRAQPASHAVMLGDDPLSRTPLVSDTTATTTATSANDGATAATAATTSSDAASSSAPALADDNNAAPSAATAAAPSPFPFTIPEPDPSLTKDVLFTRPMLYFKRSTTGRRAPIAFSRRGSSSSGGASGADGNGGAGARVPTQVILPDRSMVLGFPPVKPEDLEQEAKEEADMSSNLLVFAGPTIDQRNRARVFAYLLTFLLVSDFIVLLVLFASIGDLSVINLTDGSTDNLTFVCTSLLLLLGYVSMTLRETRVITLFIVLMFVDAMINLMRLYSVLQITHCVLQLAVCHVMIQFRASLQPTWFAPASA